MASYTDGDYSNFAVLLMNAIKKSGVQGLEGNELKEIVMNLTLYYEDVMADAGIWRGFTDKVHEMYGRYLPFYNLDEKEYMRDEPNLDDLRFIIWNTLIMNRFPQGRITNPEIPAVMKMAEAAYELMDAWFEKIPVNEDLKAFFSEAKFMDDFYEQRDVLKWLSYDCYLTCIQDYEDEINDLADDYSMFLNGNHNMASYAAESVLPYVTKMGPLALYAPEWLGAILRANGLEEKALEAEQQELKPFDIYRIRKVDAGKGIEFEDTKRENFYVTDEGLKNPSVEFYKSKTAIGAFVKYRDAWHLNATINWSQGGEELFEFTKSDVEKKIRQTDFDYDKLMSASGGSPFFYFDNYQKMKDYLSKEGGMSMEMMTGFEKPGENERIIAVVSSRDSVAFHYGDGVEFCLKDDRNPYYDEKIAKRETLTFALKLSGSALKYAMNHGMLPHVQLKSIYGAERGRALFRENYDFFARATMRGEYQ